MKILKLLSVFLLFQGLLSAQQLPLFTQYRENFPLINPAIVNADLMAISYVPDSKAAISYRAQWTKLKDSPRTFTAQYEHVLPKDNMALGATFFSDITGPTRITGGYLRYAYQAYLNDATVVSGGLSVGFMQFRYRGDLGIFRDPGDVTGFTINTKTLSDVNLGIFINSELQNYDVFYGGISAPQLASINIDSKEGNDKFFVYKTTHFYGLLGYYKFLGDGFGNLDGNLFLEPSMWVKYVPNAPVQVDLNLRFQMADVFWVGAGASVSFLDKFRRDNLHFEAGIVVSDRAGWNDRSMKIGVGYDSSITPYGPYLGGAYELNVVYAWKR